MFWETALLFQDHKGQLYCHHCWFLAHGISPLQDFLGICFVKKTEECWKSKSWCLLILKIFAFSHVPSMSPSIPISGLQTELYRAVKIRKAFMKRKNLCSFLTQLRKFISVFLLSVAQSLLPDRVRQSRRHPLGYKRPWWCWHHHMPGRKLERSCWIHGFDRSQSYPVKDSLFQVGFPSMREIT